MSEPENQPNPPSTPKTSAVPLKKETVRITLRARPGAPGATAPVSPVAPNITPKMATAPIQLPSAPLPPPAPRSATAPVKLPPAPVVPTRATSSAVPVAAAPVPSAPPSATPVAMPGRPAAPAATVPMAPPRPPGAPVAPRPPGAPAAPGAPRPVAPVAPAAPGAARVETGATTAPLTKPGAPRPPVAGTAAPGAAAGGAGLPKATVKLQQTQPIGRPPVAAPPNALSKRPAPASADSQQFYEEKDPQEGLMVPALLCFVLSVVLLGLQALGTDRFTAGPTPPMVPEAQAQTWERQVVKGGDWTNDFKLPEVNAAR